MQLLSGLENLLPEKTWITIGTFDGIHLGHQALIRQMSDEAHSSGQKSVVVTFHPHPAVVLGKRPNNINISTPVERAGYLEALGVDFLFDQLFDNNLASTSAYEYVRDLKILLNFTQLWVGHDFALGRNREGNVTELQNLGKVFGFKVRLVDPITFEGHVISSSLIRKLLWAGEVSDAQELLGRPFQLTGKVIHGDQRGRTIGFPTANLETPAEKIIPASGVYACRVAVKKNKYLAATNIGIRPTFDGKDEAIHVESHIINYADDLYGEMLTLEFWEQLRREKRFESIDALVMQIHDDIEQTKLLFQRKEK